MGRSDRPRRSIPAIPRVPIARCVAWGQRLTTDGILSTTMVYPTPARPTQGIFIARRLAAMHAVMPVRVVAPQPWFPGWRAVDASGHSPSHHDNGLSVSRPRMFYIPLVMKRWDARFFAEAFRAGLADAREQGPVGVVDAHFEWPDGVGAWLAAREAGLPFVCTLRGKLVSQSRDRVRRGMIAEMLRDADRLIAVSRSLATLACEVAGKPLSIDIIPNGIDRAVFHRTAEASRTTADGVERAALGWTAEAKYVISVGHLQRLKGFHRLVEAWPRVRRLAGDVRLILVGGSAGEPAYERELAASIARLNKGEKVRDGAAVSLLGPASPGVIATLLNAADLFALASDSEGWCNSIAEALACGCPVVATDVGGNVEIVRDSSMGRLTPPGDVESLAHSIALALSHEWDRVGIADACRGRDWAEVGAACVDVLRHAI